MKHILRCPVCKTYTMKQHCNCGEKAIDMKPAKYSPEDKYARYTKRFVEYVAMLCEMMSLKDVAKVAKINWKTAKRIDKQILKEKKN